VARETALRLKGQNMSIPAISPLRPLAPLLILAACSVADPLHITELVTDPQADHSESAGGNGTPFDLIPGSGSITPSDEFIELRHDGPQTLDLTGHTLEFFDSSPSRYTFGVSTVGTLRFSPGSTLTSLLSGAFVLLGNPPGSLNNTIEILLRDPDGTILDHWDVTNEVSGNASNAEDEALVRVSHDGLSYVHAAITPLADTPLPAPTPEPGSIWLMALSGAAALLARRRTVRRATRHTPCRSPDRRASPPATYAALPGCRGPHCVSQENE